MGEYRWRTVTYNLTSSGASLTFSGGSLTIGSPAPSTRCSELMPWERPAFSTRTVSAR